MWDHNRTCHDLAEAFEQLVIVGKIEFKCGGLSKAKKMGCTLKELKDGPISQEMSDVISKMQYDVATNNPSATRITGERIRASC
jgi:hypothetical protein